MKKKRKEEDLYKFLIFMREQRGQNNKVFDTLGNKNWVFL